jgi:hypothetical protein
MKTFYGPELNNGLYVIVVGTNLLGVHGKGAALEAKRFWGLEQGVGAGASGNTYAIPTKQTWRLSLPLDKVLGHVAEFLAYANEHPEKVFLVTPIGTGYAGYTHEQIAPMFYGYPRNCVMPKEWIEWLRKSP